MGRKRKVKPEKKNDEASKSSTSKPSTSALNTTVVNESSSRDQDSEKILRDASTQKDNHPPDSNDSIPLSASAEVTINRKLDCGYLVSVKLGPELLEGVLHHALSQREGLSKAKVATTSNQASSYQLWPQIDLNQPPLSPLLPVLDLLDQLGSSSDNICNGSPSLPPHSDFLDHLDLKLQPFAVDASVLGTNMSCDLGIAPHSNVLSRSNEVQQNPLPQYRNNQEQLTQPSNIQSSNSDVQDLLEKIKRKSMRLQSTANDLRAQSLSLESDSRALKHLLHPNLTVQTTESTSNNVLLATTLQGGENTSQAQRIHAEFNSNLIHSQPSPTPSIPIQITPKKKPEDFVTKSGLVSTSGNITANDDSNRPVSVAAKEVLSATDTDRSGSTGAVRFLQTARSTSGFALLTKDVENGKMKVEFPFGLPAKRIGSGLVSTSGNITATDESNRPVSIAAKEELSATDTDRSDETTESDELIVYKKNTYTSQEANSRGNSTT